MVKRETSSLFIARKVDLWTSLNTVTGPFGISHFKKIKIITIKLLVKTTQKQTRVMKIGLFELQDQNVGVKATKTSYLRNY